MLKPIFSISTLAIKFDCLFLAIFQSLHLFMSFIFVKLAPPPLYASKDALNLCLDFPVQKNSLISAKNVSFSLFYILLGRPTGGGGGGGAVAPPLATLLYQSEELL